MTYDVNPRNAAELIKHAKLLLGEPAIRVNVTDTQCNARLKHAVDKFIKYAYDATYRKIIVQQITQEHIDNGFIVVPNGVVQVTSIITNRGKYSNNGSFLLPESPGTILTNPMFVVRQGGEQDSLRDPMMAYFTYKNYMANYRDTLFSESSFDWNALDKKLYIHTDWRRFVAWQYLVYTAVVTNFPEDESDSDIWSNDWLIRYVSAQIQIQWGMNLGKFGSLTLPGGVQLRGDEILSQGREEAKELVTELEHNWSVSTPIYIG